MAEAMFNFVSIDNIPTLFRYKNCTCNNYHNDIIDYNIIDYNIIDYLNNSNSKILELILTNIGSVHAKAGMNSNIYTGASDSIITAPINFINNLTIDNNSYNKYNNDDIIVKISSGACTMIVTAVTCLIILYV